MYCLIYISLNYIFPYLLVSRFFIFSFLVSIVKYSITAYCFRRVMFHKVINKSKYKINTSYR